ncbi:probable C-mannosyltransferase DPY19L3 [Nematostella vectensis]|uniref:probable C-mannosyltransferase DPY19L3 n=1 Tax=Nematostella vectensis TaxID=45351 RepID=UPI0020771BC0|nr:probable C-mannosyltransferase DPY19L3 [Nematostella vectensis]
MSELRRRKLKSSSHLKEKPKNGVGNSSIPVGVESRTPWLQLVTVLVGFSVACYVGYKYALYVKELHENDMWFSNIGQVEREISFRTESGLYFSYYKQLVLAPSITKGLYDLSHDNTTEHLRTINILERFNIYQEVILAVLYRTIPGIQESVEYVYFYINSVFALHALYIVALYCTAWILSGSWLAGLLATCFYIFNKDDTTRIVYTIPLRESFGFPFLFTQMAFITYFLKRDIGRLAQVACVLGIALNSFFFTLVWQFAQFILLLQCFAFFGVYSLGFTPKHKVKILYVVVIGSLLLVCAMMFGNDMMLCSLALSFSIAALVIMGVQKEPYAPNPTLLIRLVKLVLNIVLVLFLMFALTALIKTILNVESDEHIFKFVKAKLGYDIGRDFDSLLYLCEPAFQMLPRETYQRLTSGIVFPCYVVSVVTCLALLAYTVIRNWRYDAASAASLYFGDKIHIMTLFLSSEPSDDNFPSVTIPSPTVLNTATTTPPTVLNEQPELVYCTIQTVLYGAMAVTTLRFKFLWTPHMCVFGAGTLCHQGFWRFVLERAGINKPSVCKVLGHIVPAFLIAVVLSVRLKPALEELKELREFHDPDTVELMNWIKTSTPPGSSFTGSMQLLAGVKLCTDRHVTNHPHYENKFLRMRTKQVYQVYARRTPQEVHEILITHGANYVILENSICYSRMRRGCKLSDILDMDNGHVIEGGQPREGSRDPSVPRFCDAIKRDDSAFRRYFRLVFENRTFYMYKVL